jgi:hypothetical protein
MMDAGGSIWRVTKYKEGVGEGRNGKLDRDLGGNSIRMKEK